MATYAAVVSLMNTMDAIMNDPRLYICFHKQQIQSLGQKLDILLQFIENCNYINSLGRDEKAQSLECRITSAAHAAEDRIESHIVAQIHAGVLQNAPSFGINLHQIMLDIDQIAEEIVKVEVKTGSNDQKPRNSPQPLPTGKITMIGFDNYLNQLLDGLTGSESGRLVIPIVGMGGVGKTTLTKNAYENLLIVHHFDVRAWVSISQQYDVNNILVQLLSTFGLSTQGNNEAELSERLYKFLWGRRYLVVLDDVWSITAWDEVKFSFPDDSNNSRIIVTTRLVKVANEFSFSRLVRVGLLDDNESWELFCDKAFGQRGCPNELKQIGEAIVKKCKGLPLSIVVIGALLGKSSQTKEYWENIVENMSSILSSAEDNADCLDILCLSYNHLPAHLKPCFLYLGIYGEDDEIPVSRLIKLWIAEGFIKPNKDKMLEEVAEGYVNDLLERSLILVDSLGWNKKFSSFHIHDLVRDLCLREALKEKFYSVMKTLGDAQGINMSHCIVVPRGCWVAKYGQYSHTSKVVRSLINEWGQHQPLLYGSKLLLRVLVTSNVNVKFANIVNYFKQVNMRFLSYGYDSYTMHGVNYVDELPRSIFLQWNLQTLIVRNAEFELEAPIEIWKLRQLRHVEFHFITLPEPPLSDEEDEFVVLHNLQTLTEVVDLKCSKEVCKRIPNIKKLGVCYKDFSKNSNDYCLHNAGCLNKLESLSYIFWVKPDRGHLAQNLTLPTSLKELSLKYCGLHGDDLKVIGLLPNLEVFKLLGDAFGGKEWNCVEGDFISLKYLEISRCNWTTWNVESTHFPVLDTLVLHQVTLKDGIPSGIGDIPTLRIVLVHGCTLTVQVSALKMLEEQETLGNDTLQLQLKFFGKYERERFLKWMEEEGIVCTNFNCTMHSY